MRNLLTLLTLALLMVPAAARTPVSADTQLYFIEPVDGATVTSPVTVRFGLRGMGIAPAGINAPNTGHHHLLLNTPLPPLGSPVPSDANHLHFGSGQTEITIELTPGQHTLQLLLGNHLHVPHDPPIYSPRISITVR